MRCKAGVEAPASPSILPSPWSRCVIHAQGKPRAPSSLLQLEPCPAPASRSLLALELGLSKLHVHSNWGFSSSCSLILPPHSITAPHSHLTQVPGPSRGSPSPPDMPSPFLFPLPRPKETFWRPRPFSCEYLPVKHPHPSSASPWSSSSSVHLPCSSSDTSRRAGRVCLLPGKVLETTASGHRPLGPGLPRGFCPHGGLGWGSMGWGLMS